LFLLSAFSDRVIHDCAVKVRDSRHQPHLAKVVAQSQAQTTLAHGGLRPEECLADTLCESAIDIDQAVDLAEHLDVIRPRLLALNAVFPLVAFPDRERDSRLRQMLNGDRRIGVSATVIFSNQGEEHLLGGPRRHLLGRLAV